MDSKHATENQWINKEITKGKSENTLRQMKMETLQKSMGFSKSSSKREVYSHTGIPQETRKISKKIT